MRTFCSQMAGRVARLYPDNLDCLVVDFAWLSGRHRLSSAAEFFDTIRANSESRGIAGELIAKGETDDLKLVDERAE